MLSYGEVFEHVADAQQARAEGSLLYAELWQHALENKMLLEGFGRTAIADMFDRAELEAESMQYDLERLEEFIDGR